MYGVRGKTIGGMMVKPPNLPMAAWAYYFTLGNTDEAFAKARALGAKAVYPPMDVPGGDRVAMMTDPQGATFAIHSRKA
jgi:predicted enzyme related to lactoylglutathione lyase